MENGKKQQLTEVLRGTKAKMRLLFNAIVHTLLSELKSIGSQKADQNAGVQRTMATHFRIFR